MHFRRIAAITFWFIVHTGIWVYTPVYSQNSSEVIELRQNRLHYYSDEEHNRIPDFSHSGYMGGGVPLPDISVRKTIGPISGDNSEHIQRAIDEVSARSPDSNGFRGAVLLKAGNYYIADNLHIRAGGVVLRGEGDGMDPAANTILRVSPQVRGSVLEIGNPDINWHHRRSGTITEITSEFLPVGARVFNVSEPSMYSEGDHIVIRHRSTEEWLQSIDYGGTANDPRWEEYYIEIYYYRTVVGVQDSTIAVDAPLFNHFDMNLSRPLIYKPVREDVVEQAGVENLRITILTNGQQSENHAENGIIFRGVENSWANRVSVAHFKMVGIGTETARNITIRNSRALEPHSLLTGERRYNFNTGFFSNNILFENVIASGGRRDFVSNGTSVASGIVFYNSLSVSTENSSEGHQKWTQGMLYDSITFENPRHYNVLSLYNRGNLGSSHGWGAVHSVAWNIDAENSTIYIQKPPNAQNYGIGNKGNVSGQGLFEHPAGFIAETEETPTPASLYQQQLYERLNYGIPPDMPVLVTADNSTDNQITLRWKHYFVKDTDIVIERAEGESGSFYEIARVDARQQNYFEDKDMKEALYRYRLHAEDRNGISAYTYPVSAIPRFSQGFLPGFGLRLPENESEILIAGAGNSVLEFEWDEAPEGVHPKYSFHLYDAAGNLFIQADSISTNIYGLPYTRLKQAFDDHGIRPEEVMEAYWTVQANAGTMVRSAAEMNKIHLKRGIISDVDNGQGNFTLDQNYPNPFNPVTTIQYHLEESNQVHLSVYNIAGIRVALLDEGFRDKGTYRVQFAAENLASGIYFYRLNVGGNIQSRKMLIIK